MTVNVSNYIDYRKFLVDKIIEVRRENTKFSYRYFCKKTGIKSSGFLKLVVDGKRNLGDEGIAAVCKGFNLSDPQALYFALLVKFNQAKHHEEKNYYYKQLLNLNRGAAKILCKEQYELFSHWYCVAILELLRTDTAEKKDAAWISARLKPAIGLRQVNQAIDTLTSLELVRVDEDGRLFCQDSMIAAEDDVQSMALVNFHRQMSEIAAAKVQEEDVNDREFSALTVAVDAKTFTLLKEEIRNFRKKLHALVENTPIHARDAVAHVNFQLFKLTDDEQNKRETP